jgi:hypothetical protein
MSVALFLFLQGVAKAKPFAALGAVLLGAGVLSFALNVLINLSGGGAHSEVPPGDKTGLG